MLILHPAVFILNALPKQIQDPSLLVEMDSKNKYFVKKIDNIKYNK